MPTRYRPFIEYTQPEAAELAIAAISRKMIQGHIMYVSWAHVHKRGNAPERRGETATDKPTTVRPAVSPGALSSISNLPFGRLRKWQPLLPLDGTRRRRLPRYRQCRVQVAASFAELGLLLRSAKPDRPSHIIRVRILVDWEVALRLQRELFG